MQQHTPDGARVLVVEDNRDLGRLMVGHLAAQGYAAEHRGEAVGALERIAAGGVDLVVLDLMLPRLSGDGLLARLRGREATRDLPVIVVSAKDAVWNRVDLLRLGADDYLTKPFDLDELSARIEALLRRVRPADAGSRVLRHGALALDEASQRVLVGDTEIPLTPAERAVLAALMAAPARVVSKSSLAGALGEDPVTGSSGVKTHMSHLRAKLRTVDPSTEYIETVWGLGYRMASL